ncbi:MAG: hypothetical protein ACYC2P_08095 [Paludibacteraceae bacterium]
MKEILLYIVVLLSIPLQAQENDSIRIHNESQPDTVTQENSDSNISFNGQITGWNVFQFAKPVNTQLAVRFVPTLTGFRSLTTNSKLDFEFSLNIRKTLNWAGTKFDFSEETFKPYRFWLRYSGENWEVRGGLQKINFGSAKIFRPLMWFDEMDVRDPLQLTDGVYGLLGKYFFPNNANIWLWSLIGNKNPKGFELLGSAPWIPEIGGRIETPLGPGEIAFSTHFRKADLHSLIALAPDKTYINERRIGLDGKWDLGVGLWFESSVSMFEKTDYPMVLFQDMWNFGTDYTFPIGSGLNISAEYFRYHVGNNIWKEGTSANILGSMFTYPVSLIDNISAMFFYVNEVEKFFNYLSYSRTYDNWSFYLTGYWNPEINIPIGGKLGNKNLFMGKGLQLMVNYNF